jgi:hypothetical protein
MTKNKNARFLFLIYNIDVSKIKKRMKTSDKKEID